MSANDPGEPGHAGQDPDATMLIPRPGGRRVAAAPAAASAAAARTAASATAVPAAATAPAVFAATQGGPAMPFDLPQAPDGAATRSLYGAGLNPLVCAANPLLDLIVPLRLTVLQPDIEALRARLVAALRQFEADAGAAGAGLETIAAARYALCTLLDETIASTAWGSGTWNSRSLLVLFHNEVSGGEKFFLILQKLSQAPGANIDLLELMYLCLSLGFEGRYRVLERGAEQLLVLRERLLQMIVRQRGPVETDLSPGWRGIAAHNRVPRARVPVWVMAGVAGVLLLVLQLCLRWQLNLASDPVFAALHQVKVPVAFAAEPPPTSTPAAVQAPVAAPVRLAGFLAPEIARGLVSVREGADRSVITLHGDGIFASGSAEVSTQFGALLARIGDALKPQPGRVIVIGHTDDLRPSLTARHGSNHELSKARAASVMHWLAQRAGPAQRYSVEGRGETEPLVPNDTAQHRARNRRVEIVVLAAQKGE